MSQDFNTISDDDLAILRMLILRERQTPGNTLNRAALDPCDEITAPEVYIALTPIGGIGKLTDGPDTGTSVGTGDIPSYADCTIYRIDDALSEIRLSSAGTRRVYNIWPTDIAGNEIILICREKFGKWIPTQKGFGFAPCRNSLGGMPLSEINGYLLGLEQILEVDVNGCLKLITFGTCS